MNRARFSEYDDINFDLALQPFGYEENIIITKGLFKQNKSKCKYSKWGTLINLLNAVNLLKLS